MNIAHTLMQITAYSAVIFGMLCLLKRCLGKRISPALHYALWFVLVARLMLPVTIDSGFRLFTLPVGEAAVGAPVAGAQPTEDDGNMDANAPLAPTEPYDQAAAVSPVQPAPTATAPQGAGRPSVSQTLAIVWLAGVAISLLYLTVLYVVLLRRIR